jgi:hypothetical protein
MVVPVVAAETIMLRVVMVAKQCSPWEEPVAH